RFLFPASIQPKDKFAACFSLHSSYFPIPPWAALLQAPGRRAPRSPSSWFRYPAWQSQESVPLYLAKCASESSEPAYFPPDVLPVYNQTVSLPTSGFWTIWHI